MIDVIIPTYNAKKTLNYTLLSLYEQTISDKINIYIVDDCSDYEYDDIISEFNKILNLHILRLNKNMGPGFSRKYGIENSTSKYIVFMDSDDVLYNCYSLEKLYKSIENDNCDIVISNFLEECIEKRIEHRRDKIWVHGKIYRREFLKKNNINFNSSRANEDYGFNSLCFLLNPRVSYLNETTYIWKYNYDSITRKNNHEYIFTGIFGFAFNTYWAVDEAFKKGCDEKKCVLHLFHGLYEIYLYYLKFRKINIKLAQKISNWCIDLEKCYNKYKLILSDEEKNIEIKKIILKYANNNFLRDVLSERYNFDDFLYLIEKEGNKK